jgi:hypothetical protein
VQDGKRYPGSYCRRCKAGHERHRYATNPAARAKIAERDRRREEVYPDRIAARQAVQNAIASGRLVRGRCVLAGPGCDGAIQAHHDDYSEPLAVRWVCRRHHPVLDRERLTRESA